MDKKALNVPSMIAVSFNGDCTSPSQLDEVTVAPDVTFSNSIRSPDGGRGRSIKEFEEQLSSLKRENFNLKLRIYFLEERMGSNYNLEKENVIKDNIELKVEVEGLKKEVQEKHDLLCQAVKAMELEEEEYKKKSLEKNEQLHTLEQQIEELKFQLKDCKFDSECAKSYHSEPIYLPGIPPDIPLKKDLEKKIEELTDQLNQEKQSNAALQFAIDHAETFKDKYEVLLQEAENKETKIKSLSVEVEDYKERISKYTNQMIDLEKIVDQRQQEHEAVTKKLHEQNRKVEAFESELSELRRKYNNLKLELEKEAARADKNKMIFELKSIEAEEQNEKQRQRIEKLQAKLAKTQQDLQANQNLLVPKSSVAPSSTDDDRFSAPDATTPPRVSKADALREPLETVNIPSSDSLSFTLLERELDRGSRADIKQLRDQFTILKTGYNQYSQKMVQLKAEQLKACAIIKSMINTRNQDSKKMEQQNKRITDLERELEHVVSKPSGKGDTKKTDLTTTNIEHVTTEDRVDVVDHYKRLIQELDNKMEALLVKLKDKDDLFADLEQERQTILSKLKEREDRIVDLEFELLSGQGKSEKSDLGCEKTESFYNHLIKEKDQEIDKLNSDLRKRTSDLQGVVNTELWQKNKEIVKLENRCASALKNKDLEISNLEKHLKSRDIQLNVLKDKICELGIHIDFDDSVEALERKTNDVKILEEKLAAAEKEKQYLIKKMQNLSIIDYNQLIEELREDNRKLQLEFDKCEKLRMETNEVCSILSSRLEELAMFLDSLLKQKSVLGFLGSTQNKRLQQIINQSLDLSRSLSLTLTINPEQSLMQLSNITALLNGSEFENQTQEISRIEGAVDKNFNATTNVTSPVIVTALRQQIINLQYELQLRDNELIKYTTVDLNKTPVKNEKTCKILYENKKYCSSSPKTSSTTKAYASDAVQSESEAWSEPDRNVSKARIGLFKEKLTPSPRQVVYSSESTEDELNCSRRKETTEQKKIIAELTQQMWSLEKELNVKGQNVQQLTEDKVVLEDENAKLKDTLENLESHLQEIEMSLISAEGKKLAAETQVDELQRLVDELTLQKNQLEADVNTKEISHAEIVRKFETEKQSLVNKLQESENNLTKSNQEIALLKEKMSRLSGQLTVLQKEYEEKTIEKLKSAEHEFVNQLKNVEERSQAENKMLKDTINKIKADREAHYISRSEVSSKIQEAEALTGEMHQLKEHFNEYKTNCALIEQSNLELTIKLDEYQEKIHVLRQELDNATVLYSDAVIEKTKIANEKNKLENEMTKLSNQESDMKNQINEVQIELNNVRDNYRTQYNILQSQKIALERKVHELEARQGNPSRTPLSTSLPIDILNNRQSQLYRRQLSDEANGDDVRNRNAVYNPLASPPPVDMERHEANSSPDLGIESDHGRFSSLEAQNAVIPRPLLQTLDLTETMNSLLGADNNSLVQKIYCENDVCCQKTAEMANENSDLKRKLLRTRRALEETVTQLTLANQRKKQVEKTICKQIHKTSQVLRKAKANLDSGSETDIQHKEIISK